MGKKDNQTVEPKKSADGASQETQAATFKGIKSPNALENFSKALPSVLAKSDTKNVITTASKGGDPYGDLTSYKEALKKLKLKGIRDYNFVLVIFSPIVAAAQAVINYAKTNNGNLDIEHKYLRKLVNDVLSHVDFRDHLCTNIGAGNGPEIKKTLERFTHYKNLLKEVSGGIYGKNGDPFMERASQITKWKVNGNYITYKLIPFVQGVFDSKYAIAVRGGLSHATPENPAPIPPQASVAPRGTMFLQKTTMGVHIISALQLDTQSLNRALK